MSTINVCLILLAIIGASVPACYGLAWIPCLIVIQSLFLESDRVAFSIGPADVTASDFAIMVLLGRYVFEIVRGRDVVRDKAIFTAIALYLGVVFSASLFSSLKFGPPHTIRCFTSCVRLVPEMLIVAMMANSLKNLTQARRCAGILFGLLGVLVAIQFVNFLGARHGFKIGEVQGIERGELRYFGPVGDSVGFVLLLGYLLALCYGRLVLAVLVLASIALTAGLGSMFAAVVATGFSCSLPGRLRPLAAPCGACSGPCRHYFSLGSRWGCFSARRCSRRCSIVRKTTALPTAANSDSPRGSWPRR